MTIDPDVQELLGALRNTDDQPLPRRVPTMTERVGCGHTPEQHRHKDGQDADNRSNDRAIRELAAERDEARQERDEARKGWQLTADALAKAHTGWGAALAKAAAAADLGSPSPRAQDDLTDRLAAALADVVRNARGITYPDVREHFAQIAEHDTRTA